MKIAVIIDTWFPAIGGGQINAWEIGKRLAQKGSAVDIITRNNGKYKLEKIKNLHLFSIGTLSKPDDNISRALFLIRSFFFLLNKNYDVIHLQAFLPGLLALPIRYFLKKPVVFTVHGTRMFEKNPQESFGFLLEKFILTKIKYDALISVTKVFLKFKNANENTYHIPNAVNIEKFERVKAPKARYPKILWVGRFDPVKRLEDLLKAMKILQKQLPTAKLTIVGYGKDEKKLRQLAKTLKLSNIEFVGKKEDEDLIKEYRSSHVFVLCSSSEGQPLTILEAMAAELPIVTTRVGGIDEIVNSDYALFLSSGSSNKIAQAILRILRENKTWTSGYKHKKNLKTWDDVANLTLKVYEKQLEIFR